MRRSLLVLSLLALPLSACGDSPDDATDRCQEAKATQASWQKYLHDFTKQTPSFTKSAVYQHAIDDATTEDDRAFLDLNATAFQIVSDNARCFTVAEVAESRRGLKLIDQLGPLLPPTRSVHQSAGKQADRPS